MSSELLKNADKLTNVVKENRCGIDVIKSCPKMIINIKSAPTPSPSSPSSDSPTSPVSSSSSENDDNEPRYRHHNNNNNNKYNNKNNNNNNNNNENDNRHHVANNQTETNTRAQRRWRLLARALARSPEPSEDVDRLLHHQEEEREVSVRRFTTFGLVNPTTVLENLMEDHESTWYEYTAVIEKILYRIEIREINKIFTANELIGFNNTGNICVWPSEECLAHYLLTNKNICNNKTVLELGGGMSCLAGVFVAKYCSPSAVSLTDGNVTSVDNARCIVARNNMNDFIKCGVVQWERAAKSIRQDNANANHVRQTWGTMDTLDEGRSREGLYDVILSADCLFFDEARLDLVETIFGWLSEDGIALIVAPRRGSTFQKFIDAAIDRGFLAKQKEIYDPIVWSRHIELTKNNQEYSPDLHYPVLLELTKINKSPG